MKPRTCPNCGYIIPADYGFHFDGDMNLVHDRCNKPAFCSGINKPKTSSYKNYRFVTDGRQNVCCHGVAMQVDCEYCEKLAMQKSKK